MANQHVAAIMEKEMTRKEFIATVALAAGSVMGLSSIISMLTGKSLGGSLRHSQTAGYGASVYGGGKN